MTRDHARDPSDQAPDHGPVAVLGTGALGTAVGAVLLGAGCELLVWNRNPSRTRSLTAGGATRLDDVEDAVGRSRLVLVCLSDPAAVREVLSRLPSGSDGAGDASSTTVAVLTTGSPEDAEGTAALLEARGLQHVDVGVQTAPEDIGTPRATLLYSGSHLGFRTHRPTLELLGPTRWLGPDPRAAATWDLALFGLWYDAQVGLLRAFEAAREAGVPLADFAPAAARQVSHTVDAAVATAGEITNRRYPRGPATLEEHLPVLQRLVAARHGGSLGDGGLAEVERLARGQVEAGHGGHGLTALLDAAMRRR